MDAPGVLENDTDPEGDQLTAELVGAPQNGTLNLNADGSFTYEPAENFNGQDSFTYRASDGSGGSDTATVGITVNPTNDDPVAENDADRTDEDTPVTTDVTANDSDPDGDPLAITDFTQPENGAVDCDPQAGACTYTPDDNFNGTDSYSYTLGDGNGGTDTATVEITVDPVNDGPQASNDAYETGEDQTLTVPAPGVLGNDTDPDGDPLVVQGVVQQPEAGELTQNSDGSFTYDPAPNFNGQDSYSYRVSDGNGGTDVATVAINVTSVNDSPVAQDDEASTEEDEPVNIAVLGNDSDPENDPLTLDGVTQPENGTVQANGDGTVTYEPNQNFNGQDTFTYTVSDGNGGTDTATVTITVEEQPNQPPQAENDTADTTAGEPVEVDVLANDTDPEEDPLTVTGTGEPANGTVTVGGGGNNVTYTPDEGFVGEDSFEYTISDGNGNTDTGTVTVTVAPAPNAEPVARNDSYSVESGSTLNVDAPGVLENDSDPDGNELTAELDREPENGQVMLNPDGSFEYTPTPGYTGSDSFTYTASDGQGDTTTATVNITVEAPPEETTAPEETTTPEETTVMETTEETTIPPPEETTAPPEETTSTGTTVMETMEETTVPEMTVPETTMTEITEETTAPPPEETTVPPEETSSPETTMMETTEGTTAPPEETILLEETTAPLEETTSPPEETAIPENTNVPETTIVETTEETVTPEETTTPLPLEKTTAPPEETTTPEETTAPPAGTTAPPEKTTAPVSAEPGVTSPEPTKTLERPAAPANDNDADDEQTPALKDADNNGIADAAETDSDEDGILDADLNQNGTVSPQEEAAYLGLSATDDDSSAANNAAEDSDSGDSVTADAYSAATSGSDANTTDTAARANDDAADAGTGASTGEAQEPERAAGAATPSSVDSSAPAKEPETLPDTGGISPFALGAMIVLLLAGAVLQIIRKILLRRG